MHTAYLVIAQVFALARQASGISVAHAVKIWSERPGVIDEVTPRSRPG